MLKRKCLAAPCCGQMDVCVWRQQLFPLNFLATLRTAASHAKGSGSIGKIANTNKTKTKKLKGTKQGSRMASANIRRVSKIKVNAHVWHLESGKQKICNFYKVQQQTDKYVRRTHSHTNVITARFRARVHRYKYYK